MASVQMPRLSDSMETGKILRWLKKEGEDVKKGEPLVEIESDKANIEVEAYASGKLSKIVVPEGESAPIGAVIAEIGDASAAAAAEKAPAPQGQAEAAEPKQGARPASAETPKAQATKPGAHVAQADKAVAATAQAADDGGDASRPERVLGAPLLRHLRDRDGRRRPPSADVQRGGGQVGGDQPQRPDRQGRLPRTDEVP